MFAHQPVMCISLLQKENPKTRLLLGWYKRVTCQNISKRMKKFDRNGTGSRAPFPAWKIGGSHRT